MHMLGGRGVLRSKRDYQGGGRKQGRGRVGGRVTNLGRGGGDDEEGH